MRERLMEYRGRISAALTAAALIVAEISGAIAALQQAIGG